MNDKVEFRWQRGSLEDSMATVCEVESLQDIRKLMEKEPLPFGGVQKLECKYVCFDARIRWNTWMIVADGKAIGYANAELK